MIHLFITINTLIFLFLSLLHVYWAMGGKWAYEGVFPQNPTGEKPLTTQPGIVATLIVAGGLFLFALVTLGNSGIFDQWLKIKYFHTGLWIITGIFLLRTVGDFKYVGFSKKIKGTLFAKKDTQIYSPLTLGISLVNLFILYI